MTLQKSRFLRGGTAISAVLLAPALLIAGCAETQLGAQAVKEVARSNDAPAAQASAPELAPEAFDATGLTIWDGASTLEGVWVAHPLAQRAQRVRVINQENEIAIEGAMFRRDPTLSGPSILVSSDAARMLGLQPGLPTELRIIALREGVYARPTTVQTEADPAPAGNVETATLAAPEPVAEPSEPAEATETAEAAPETQSAPEQPVAAEVETETATDEATSEPAPAEPTIETAEPPAPPQRPKSAITAADLVGATSQPAPAPAAEPAPTAQPEPAAERTPEAAPEPAPAPTEPAATAAAAPSASAGAYQGELPSGQFVQVGAFGVEPNAAGLVQRLRAAGQPATYVKREVNGALLNVVVIGPLATQSDVDNALAAASAQGVSGARRIVR